MQTSKLKSISAIIFLIVLLFAKDITTVRAYGAVYKPTVLEYRAEFVEIIPEPVAVEQMAPPKKYTYVPQENHDLEIFVLPPMLLGQQMGAILRWRTLANNAANNHPNVNAMIILGIMAQETQGKPSMECNGFDFRRGTCAAGLMGIMPGKCGLSIDQIRESVNNVNCGAIIFNQIYEQAIEKGFRPGMDAVRATLGAYNCGWKSLFLNKCYKFGGFAYADKIMFYWIPLLINHVGDLEYENPKVVICINSCDDRLDRLRR
jgi:hypothetical protein